MKETCIKFVLERICVVVQLLRGMELQGICREYETLLRPCYYDI